jgi:hypothetical protein
MSTASVVLLALLAAALVVNFVGRRMALARSRKRSR